MIKRTHADLYQTSTATFSDCGKYRYSLVRQWDSKLPGITYLMLNPSTADELQNDPTIERCQRRAIAYGYGRMEIVNLFPFRMTDSTQLSSVNDLFGDMNAANSAIIKAVQESEMTICGWGKHDLAKPRAFQIVSDIKAAGFGIKLYCLAKNNDGSPQHPLYISYQKRPVPY